MDDTISRQAAIELVGDLVKGILSDSATISMKMSPDYLFENLYKPIRQMPSAQQWIPCSEKGVEFPCLACDVFGQMFITKSGIVKVNGEYYDGDGFDFDNAEEFLKGKKVWRSMRMLPRKIVAWMPLPEPYRERR